MAISVQNLKITVSSEKITYVPTLHIMLEALYAITKHVEMLVYEEMHKYYDLFERTRFSEDPAEVQNFAVMTTQIESRIHCLNRNFRKHSTYGEHI